MPNIRKQARTQKAVGVPELVHFAKGFCLVSGGCAICTDRGPQARYRWVLNLGKARKLWTDQRGAILAQWYSRCEARGEPGACGVPLFAECLFDNVPLPPLDLAWPEIVQQRHDTIRRNLELHKDHFRIYGLFTG